MRKLGLIVAILGVVFATTADAKTYRWAGMSKRAIEVIDVETIKRSGEKVQAWTVLAMADADPFAYAMTKNEYDCEAELYRLLSGSYYDADGKSAFAAQPGAWKPAIPDTLGADTLKVVCATASPRRPDFEDTDNFALAKRLRATFAALTAP